MLWQEIVYLTPAQAKQAILELLDGVGFTATSWADGTLVDGFTWIGGYVLSKATEVAVALKEAHQLSTAEDAALDAYMDSQYDEDRRGAVAAQYLIQLDCEAGEGPHSLDVGDVVVTDDEFTYRNIAGAGISYPYNLAGGASVTLLFEAEVAGAESTVAASTIDTLQTTYAGVTVNTSGNSLQTSGLDRESATVARERCRTKWPTLTLVQSTEGKVKHLALSADQTVTRVEVDGENPRGEGTVDCYLATDVGPASAGAVANVQAAVEDLFFQSNAFLAIASAADPLAITATLYYDPAYDSGDVSDAVDEALLSWFASIPLGGFSYGAGLEHVVTLEDIRSALKSATIDGVEVIRTLVLTTPAANVAISDFDVVTQGSHSLTYTASAT